MDKKSAGKAGGAAGSRDLVERIEDERKKLEDISLADLSRPEVIGRQQGFDAAVVEFMRERLAAETEKKD